MYDAFYSPPLSDSEFDSKPMVMLVGQYSTGKTSVRYGRTLACVPAAPDAGVWEKEGVTARLPPPALLACSFEKPRSPLSLLSTHTPQHTTNPVHSLPHRPRFPGAAHRAGADDGPLHRRDGRAGGARHPRWVGAAYSVWGTRALIHDIKISSARPFVARTRAPLTDTPPTHTLSPSHVNPTTHSTPLLGRTAGWCRERPGGGGEHALPGPGPLRRLLPQPLRGTSAFDLIQFARKEGRAQTTR